ncbi:putative ABC transporter permease [Propionicicella superfundia]|uniref:putative ABC transporter permease n=1 Tax=Propionicicella superfundia TaxID=348582 RepID=UPI0004075C91|nr:putative ABC transporter permease [Propionicicella superfundia]
MTALDASVTALCFLAYGFLGWVAEGAVAVFQRRWFANPGFLAGPVVPIYGVGALAILVATRPVDDDPLLVFLLSVAIATAVEFIGHLALEKTLGLVLWDYTGHVGNIQGRVCTLNSLAFGVGGVLVVFVFDPWLRGSLAALGVTTLVSIASALGALFVADLARSVVVVAASRPEVRAAWASLSEVRAQIELQLDLLSDSLEGRRRRQRVRRLRRASEVFDRLARAFPAARVIATLPRSVRGERPPLTGPAHDPIRARPDRPRRSDTALHN